MYFEKFLLFYFILIIDYSRNNEEASIPFHLEIILHNRERNNNCQPIREEVNLSYK